MAPPAGVVAKVTARSQKKQRRGDRRMASQRTVDEIAEPCMWRAYKTPEYAQSYQSGNGVAYGDMEAIQLVAS